MAPYNEMYLLQDDKACNLEAMSLGHRWLSFTTFPLCALILVFSLTS